MWTSYDYLTPYKIQDDLVIGGVLNFQLFKFPEFSKQAASKFIFPSKHLKSLAYPTFICLTLLTFILFESL